MYINIRQQGCCAAYREKNIFTTGFEAFFTLLLVRICLYNQTCYLTRDEALAFTLLPLRVRQVAIGTDL